MAIEHVYVHNNTGVIPDEVLAHRLGLIPLNADASKFEFCQGSPTDKNTLVFKLSASCDPFSKDRLSGIMYIFSHF